MERQAIISLLQEVLRGHERQAELLQRLKRSVSEEGNDHEIIPASRETKGKCSVCIEMMYGITQEDLPTIFGKKIWDFKNDTAGWGFQSCTCQVIQPGKTVRKNRAKHFNICKECFEGKYWDHSGMRLAVQPDPVIIIQRYLNRDKSLAKRELYVKALANRGVFLPEREPEDKSSRSSQLQASQQETISTQLSMAPTGFSPGISPSSFLSPNQEPDGSGCGLVFNGYINNFNQPFDEGRSPDLFEFDEIMKNVTDADLFSQHDQDY